MSKPSGSPLLRHASTKVHGRYFVSPAASAQSDFWFVGFHGQAQTAEAFMLDLERVPHGDRWLLAAVQGLNTYYTGRTRAIVANWMTSQDRELAIADNVRWVNTVLDELEREFGAPKTIVFAGFSQGVAMAYRAGLLCARTCAAVVAVGGDVPPELRTEPAREWPMLLTATGARDPWFTPARLEEDLTFLRSRRPDARALIFEGAHEWTDEVAESIGQLLAEIEHSAP